MNNEFLCYNFIMSHTSKNNVSPGHYIDTATIYRHLFKFLLKITFVILLKMKMFFAEKVYERNAVLIAHS